MQKRVKVWKSLSRAELFRRQRDRFYPSPEISLWFSLREDFRKLNQQDFPLWPLLVLQRAAKWGILRLAEYATKGRRQLGRHGAIFLAPKTACRLGKESLQQTWCDVEARVNIKISMLTTRSIKIFFRKSKSSCNQCYVGSHSRLLV